MLTLHPVSSHYYDSTLSENGIVLEFGRVKNPNKNSVAERAIQELEHELLKTSYAGKPLTAMKLAIITARLNCRIRSRGLSALEMLLQRDQFTNQQLPVSDRTLIESQQKAREVNHPYSERSKAPFVLHDPSPNPPLQPGDLIYLISDK